MFVKSWVMTAAPANSPIAICASGLTARTAFTKVAADARRSCVGGTALIGGWVVSIRNTIDSGSSEICASSTSRLAPSSFTMKSFAVSSLSGLPPSATTVTSADFWDGRARERRSPSEEHHGNDEG